MPTTRMSSQFGTFRLTVAAQMADYRKRMADQIRKEREKRGWRREDLAQKTGASYRQIERWETGKSRPQIGNRMALAEAFEIPLAQLFPDLEAEEEALRKQLDRIERQVGGIYEMLRLLGAELLPLDEVDEVVRDYFQERTESPGERREPGQEGSAEG